MEHDGPGERPGLPDKWELFPGLGYTTYRAEYIDDPDAAEDDLTDCVGCEDVLITNVLVAF